MSVQKVQVLSQGAIGPQGPIAPMATVDEIRAGLIDTKTISPQGRKGAQAFLEVFEGSRKRAIVFDDDLSRIDLENGRTSRPAAGYIDFGDLLERPAKWYPHGMVAVWELNDSPEFVGRRSEGQFVDGQILAQTRLAAPISQPFSSLTQITATDLHDGTVTWLPSGYVMVKSAVGSTFGVWQYSTRNTATGVISGLTFLNGSQGVGGLEVGSYVKGMSGPNVNLLLFYGQADMGEEAGFQDRSAYQTAFTSECHRPAEQGGYWSAGHWRWGTSSPGPRSQRREQMILDEKGSLALLGSTMLDKSNMVSTRFVVAAKNTRTFGTTVLPSATLPVLDPSNFPTTGVRQITVQSDAGAQTLTYTGYSINVALGCWELTGVTGGTGTVADQAFVQLTKDSIPVVISGRGNVAAWNDASDDTVIIGKTGPGTLNAWTGHTEREAAIQFGGASGIVRLYRGAPSELWSEGAFYWHMAGGNNDAIKIGLTTDTEPRLSFRGGSVLFGVGTTTPVEVGIRRTNTLELGVRNTADNADGDFKMARARITGPLTHTGTSIGLNGSTPVTKSAGWGAPTGTASKAAFDTATVTVPVLAGVVKSLVDYFTTRGDIGA